MQNSETYFKEKDLKKFNSFEGEEILIAKRNHPFSLYVPILTATLIMFSFFGLEFYLFASLFKHVNLFIITTLITLQIFGYVMIKLFIDWYFHMYVVTSKRILEFLYFPLFSDVINEVLLDQVRCTEIDVKINGLINEIIDRGSIVLTFDRPTHQEECVLCGIKNPREVGSYLTNVLNAGNSNSFAPIWKKSKIRPESFKFIEEIFPHSSLGNAV